MARESLTRQFRHIQDEVILLGSMVEKATLRVVDALARRDKAVAQEILENDRLINEKRFAIENAVLILIATQQPMARDLRGMAAILEVTTELERMGDYAKGIAKVIIRLGDADVPVPIADIQRMAEMAVGMLNSALSAFIDEDASRAYRIPQLDDDVDDLYQRIYRSLVKSMIANPESIDQINLLIWVIHNLERLADRVTNICERTVFIATGELMEMDTSDDEDTAA